MAVLDFLNTRNRTPIAAYFNHGTSHGNDAEKFVKDYCRLNKIELLVGKVRRCKRPGESQEVYWRNERYRFLDKIAKDVNVITAHQLDDEIENYLFTSIRNGSPSLIPYKRGNVIRPFLLTRRSSFESWCERKNVPYLNDPGNKDFKYTRSFIRSEVVPKALVINPGMHKMVSKMVSSAFEKGGL